LRFLARESGSRPLPLRRYMMDRLTNQAGFPPRPPGAGGARHRNGAFRGPGSAKAADVPLACPLLPFPWSPLGSNAGARIRLGRIPGRDAALARHHSKRCRSKRRRSVPPSDKRGAVRGPRGARGRGDRPAARPFPSVRSYPLNARAPRKLEAIAELNDDPPNARCRGVGGLRQIPEAPASLNRAR
jgi:hypothetical protein